MASNKLSDKLEAELTRLYKAWGPQQAEQPTFAIWAATRQSLLNDLRKFARMAVEEHEAQQQAIEEMSSPTLGSSTEDF